MARPTIVWQSLKEWPPHRKPTTARSGDTFRASLGDTLDKLETELARIRATNVVVEIDVSQAELRRGNGEPVVRASVRKTPGIVLHYTDKDGRAVTMPADRYRTWSANLRALALTLESLRAVDRHGATSSGEQYRGWMALTAITTPAMTTAKAARTIVSFAGGNFSESGVLASADECRRALQYAFAKTHPDRHMGDKTDFQLVGECKRIMQAHHGVDL